MAALPSSVRCPSTNAGRVPDSPARRGCTRRCNCPLSTRAGTPHRSSTRPARCTSLEPARCTAHFRASSFPSKHPPGIRTGIRHRRSRIVRPWHKSARPARCNGCPRARTNPRKPRRSTKLSTHPGTPIAPRHRTPAAAHPGSVRYRGRIPPRTAPALGRRTRKALPRARFPPHRIRGASSRHTGATPACNRPRNGPPHTHGCTSLARWSPGLGRIPPAPFHRTPWTRAPSRRRWARQVGRTPGSFQPVCHRASVRSTLAGQSTACCPGRRQGRASAHARHTPSPQGCSKVPPW
jgi:hypothetical protein